MPKDVQGKWLILVRHAHRDTSDREADNGLSEKGLRQAARIREYFEKEMPQPSNARILSSRKLRCVETVGPVANLWNVPVEIDALLMEQQSTESHQDLVRKAARFIENWKNSENVMTLACSHGDWLPVATQLLLGYELSFEKGSFARFRLRGTDLKLDQVITQDLLKGT